MNTQKLSGATITDIGVRYQTKTAGTPVIYRLYISNLLNKNYWMSGSFVGDPRTISLSAQMKL
jgi:iron complex outermembrane receptor protein